MAEVPQYDEMVDTISSKIVNKLTNKLSRVRGVDKCQPILAFASNNTPKRVWPIDGRNRTPTLSLKV